MTLKECIESWTPERAMAYIESEDDGKTWSLRDSKE